MKPPLAWRGPAGREWQPSGPRRAGQYGTYARRIAANIAKLPLLTCPRNLIQPAPLSRVSGQETTPPIPSPKFPVREAPLAPRRAGLSLAADPQQGA
jgi:hypothetical protein